jgi:tetratricopeptide repeat protein 21B
MREYTEALATLQRALDVMKQLKLGKGKPSFLLNAAQHTSVYVELAQVHVRLKNVDEAHRIIHEASVEMKGSTEEGRITMVQAMITARKDVDMALNILRGIPNTSPYFLKAKAQMANLFLTQRSNRREFARCYEDLVEAYPSVSSYTFLGEAYLNIQEPERAIAALEKARSLDPNDAELAGKIGRALMVTHDYQRGLRYYRDAVAADPTRWSLRHDLAGLYSRLGDHEKAIMVLREGIDNMKTQSGGEDLPSCMDKVRTMMMLAKVYKKVNDVKAVTECLVQARVFQNTVLNRMRGETSDAIYKQRSVAANICYDLGQYYVDQGQPEKALSLFNEALKFEETNDRSMLALANLYLERGELEGCEQQCNALLRVVPGSEPATIMLADIMFRKNKFDDAAFHYQSLLERKPNNYEALVRYIQLLRYGGKLPEAAKFFATIDKGGVSKTRLDPGLHYAKGLFYRYTNEPQNALKEFHLGRHPRENPWAEKCVTNMIEIYLNPDNENIWEDTGDQMGDQISENVRTAEKLLYEITDRNKKTILEAYVLIATKRKDNLEKALAKFYEIMSTEKGGGGAVDMVQPDKLEDTTGTKPKSGNEPPPSNERVNVACLVGMSTALQLMKQTPKARNHLKRVAKAPYFAEDGDHFERGWLMLADIYIEGGKFDLAQDLLKRALQSNKSCGRAWEFMGLIYEKEQSYNDASECYECAWKLVNESDPGIGYKLSFNYLKARRYVNAIDVCTKVLTMHPKYPKIRKDVLEKARAGLRP